MSSISLDPGLRAQQTLPAELDAAYRQCLGILSDCRKFGFTGHFRKQVPPTSLLSDLRHRDGSRLTIRIGLGAQGKVTLLDLHLAGTLCVGGQSAGSGQATPVAARMLTGDIERALTSQGLLAAMQVIHHREAIHACHLQASQPSSQGRMAGPSASLGFAAYPGPTSVHGFAAYPGPTSSLGFAAYPGPMAAPKTSE